MDNCRLCFSDREAHFLHTAGYYIASATMTTISHPIIYVKTLGHVGYQPILRGALAQKNTTLSRGFYPYAKSIYQDVGFLNLYTGYLPRFVGNLLFGYIELNANSLLERRVKDNLSTNAPAFDDGSNNDCESPNLGDYLVSATKRFFINILATIICHPFNVLSSEMMLSSLFKDGMNTFTSSIKHIWTNEGFLGFYRGLSDQLKYTSQCIVLTLFLYYIVISIPQFSISSNYKKNLYLVLSMVSAIQFKNFDQKCTISRIDGSRSSTLLAERGIISIPSLFTKAS